MFSGYNDYVPCEVLVVHTHLISFFNFFSPPSFSSLLPSVGITLSITMSVAGPREINQ